MTGRVIRLGGGQHQAAEELLPWYVNGTLDDDDRALVQAHLDQCPACREEVGALRAFAAEYAAADPASDPGPALDRLRERMLQRPADGNTPAQPATRPQPSPMPGRWMPWALAAEFAAIAILGVLLAAAYQRPAEYRTLGAPEATPRGDLVVVFDPRLPESEMRRILRDTGSRIVDGPTSTHAYVLQVPAAQQATALAALRSERGVSLAERLEGGR